MLNEIKTEKGTFLFVEVADDATAFKIETLVEKYLHFLEPSINFMAHIGTSVCLHSEEDFQIISTTKDITEEQMESIVGKVFCKCRYGSFMTFSHPCKKECQYPISAIESFQALLCANKLELNKNYLILKKI